MKLSRPDIPAGIDADLSIAVASIHLESASKEMNIPLHNTYVYKGVQERTAKGDDLLMSLQANTKKNSVRYILKRESLYHILPEYLFHPLDRYSGCDGDEEEFLKRRKEQKQTKENALKYFYPFDRAYQEMRTSFQLHLNDRILRNNTFIVDFITEGKCLNRKNQFIERVYPCILWLRAYRGVKRLTEMAIRFAFSNNIVKYSYIQREEKKPIDMAACHCSLDGTIDDLFCGNSYTEFITIIRVVHQTLITSHKQIEILNREIEEFRDFFQSWFLSLNQHIEIVFGDYKKEPFMYVGSSDSDLYLNYNTQII